MTMTRFRATAALLCLLCLAAFSGEPRLVCEDATPKNVSLASPVVSQPLDIHEDIVVEFPNAAFAFKPDAKVRMRMFPVGVESIPEFSPFQLDKAGRVPVSREKLKELYRQSPARFLARPVEIGVLFPKGYYRSVRLILVDRAKKADGFQPCSIQKIQGRPHFVLGTQVIPSLDGNLSWEYHKFNGFANRRFARAGIHGNLVSCYPNEKMSVDPDGTIHYDVKAYTEELTKAFAWMAAEDPQAVYQLFWSLFLPEACTKVRPEEMLQTVPPVEHFYNQVTVLTKIPCRQPSYASEYWRKYAGDALRATLKALEQTVWADRIFAVKLRYANGGEWNNMGYIDKKTVDFSQPAQKAFAAWLRKKYQTDAALQQAWGRNDVTLDNQHLVPSPEERMRGQGPFRIGGKQVQSSVDYYQYWQEYTVQTIEFFARIVKDVSKGKLLAGAYYGYYWGHLTNMPYHCQDSGHYGMRYANRSSVLDFVGGPAPYWRRQETLLLNGIALSSSLHGKLWQSEFDTRTHRSTGRKEFGITDNLTQTLAILKRDFAFARAQHSTGYYYSFMAPWYADSEVFSTFRRLLRMDKELLGRQESFPREVAVVVSEETLPHISSIKEPTGALSQLQEDVFFELNRTGIPFDTILESDLSLPECRKYKCFLFLNAYYASPETRQAIAQLRQQEKSLLFLYAPGVISEANELDLDGSRQLTGVAVSRRTATGKNNIFWKGERGITLNDKDGLPFRFQVADDEAEPFALYEDDAVAGAWKKNGKARDGVLCSPSVNHLFLRKWLTSCGIACYQEKGSAYCCFTGPVVTLYDTAKAQILFRLPRNRDFVADLESEIPISPVPSVLKIYLDPATNCMRQFYVGSREGWFEFSR